MYEGKANDKNKKDQEEFRRILRDARQTNRMQKISGKDDKE